MARPFSTNLAIPPVAYVHLTWTFRPRSGLPAAPGPGLNFLLGYFRPFDGQHLKPLYNSHEQYVGAVINDTRKLVNQRYITREDGDEIIHHAKNSDVPTLADIPSDVPDDLR